MPRIAGTILLTQESRIRLLADDGRGHVFVLAPGAPLEPQDLPSLVGARVHIEYETTPRLLAGVIRDIFVTERPA